jgi:hypothetical protein
MSDLGIVPVGFNSVIKSEYELTSQVPSGPRSFISKPSFEFYRDPESGQIESIEGTALLASRVLYKLFTPFGSYAVDTSKGSYLENLVGGNLDKASVTVSLVRAIQKIEEELKETTEFIYSVNPDEDLDFIKVDSLNFDNTGEVIISLIIKAQSGKISSLQVGV